MENNKLSLKPKIKNLNNGTIVHQKLNSAIEFDLPINSKVNLFLSDLKGNILFRIINNRFLKKGHYLRKFDFNKLPAGEYSYKLQTDIIEVTRILKMM